jgi:hypothetical protein
MKTKEFHHSKVKLGKKEYQHDDRTLMLAKYLPVDIRVPADFDFDANRRPIPNNMWGNDEFGDCVIAGEANEILRLERVETWQTAQITDEDAINRYKHLTGCKEAGDENDTGLEIIAAHRDWRNNGFKVAYKGRTYFIDAYGEIDPSDREQVRLATFLLHGTQWGVWLPEAAQQMTNEGKWDYKGETGPEWKPGSWGGHCVYSKKFSPDSIFVETWDMEIEVTNAFIDKYADEAWGVVDNLDEWRKSGHLDVDAMEKRLSEITTKVNQ